MLLSELKVAAQVSKGTYVAALPSESTKALLRAWADENRFELANDLHVTILYSRTPINVVPHTEEFVATGDRLEVLGGCLVLKLNCPGLLNRHEALISQGGTHDFDSYIPHITLQKDTKLKPEDVPMPMFGLIFGNEYSEELQP